MTAPTIFFLYVFCGALSFTACAATNETQLGLKGLEIGASLSELKRHFTLKCKPPETSSSWATDTPSRSRIRCSFTNAISIGEQNSSVVDLVFFEEQLHQIRVAIDWNPPKGDRYTQGGSAKLYKDVRVLSDELSLKYPTAKREKWRNKRGWKVPFFRADTWSMPFGKVTLIYRSAISPSDAMELWIESAASNQLIQLFEDHHNKILFPTS